MSAVRILITGFTPFPGAPANPTMPLVARLMRLRRPAFDGIVRIAHIFPVTYEAVDRDLPRQIAAHRPDALLMFGLATRTPFLRVEMRVRNARTVLWPDAAHAHAVNRTIIAGGPARVRFGPHTPRLLCAARATGIDARISQDAGAYLCNYLSWRAIEATRQPGGPRHAAFIHVPQIPRGRAFRRIASRPPVTFEQLVDAGEAMLLEMARIARRA